MDEKRLAEHISKISTVWTLLRKAHHGSAATRADAQQEMLERYHVAVYRYLAALTGNPDTADELFQVFALKWVRGDFSRADPERGRFRDFLKTTLINLVLNQRKKQHTEESRRRPLDKHAADMSSLAVDDPDEAFLLNWRKALLDRAWERLAEESARHTAPLYHALRFYSEHALSSEQLAQLLTRTVGPEKPFTAAHVRKLLQRARERFADLLLTEVAQSLPQASAEEVHRELVELGFIVHCRDAFTERFGS